jgi:hypothetical protein
MNTNRRVFGRLSGRRGEAGFALVLAILALMLLTFLGLTLAATSSTELQIATNYRWGQQAFYNAEAGLEVAKLMMSDWPVNSNFSGILPPTRGGTWTLAAQPPPDPDPGGFDAFGNPLRNYASRDCDNRNNVGYGLVWSNGGPSAPYQAVTQSYGQPLNGAFTLWARRVVEVSDTGNFSYLAGPNEHTDFIVTSEGVAPYTGQAAGGATAFTNANQAVRVLETRLARAQGGSPCNRQAGQAGGSSSGAGFAQCVQLTPGSLGGLGATGGLGDTGVQ